MVDETLGEQSNQTIAIKNCTAQVPKYRFCTVVRFEPALFAPIKTIDYGRGNSGLWPKRLFVVMVPTAIRAIVIVPIGTLALSSAVASGVSGGIAAISSAAQHRITNHVLAPC